jgi:hypothetical protein
MRGYNNNNNNNTTVLLILIISNNREVIKIPLGKGIVNCREICGPMTTKMTRLSSIKENIKNKDIEQASRLFYFIHSEVQDDRHCGCRDRMKYIVECRDRMKYIVGAETG